MGSLSLPFKIVFPLISVLLIAFFLIREYEHFITSPLLIDKEGITYTIKLGKNLGSISQELAEMKLSPFHPIYFYIYGRLNGKSHFIKAGEYHITKGTTYPQLLEQFITGRVIQHAITIIEGSTVRQLIKTIHSHPHIIKTFDIDMEEQALLAKIGIPEKHIEGWFYPETYYFPTGSTDSEFLQRAYRRMKKALELSWKNKDPDLPYVNSYEALIMASIIEKEAGIAEEKSQIAGVFVRRLKKGMRLQADPSVIYGMGDSFDGNISKKDLKMDTPYNTYTRFGLPPTPIALADLESIKAALHPAEGDSLYFVATGEDGRHKFSSSLKEHNNAVRHYQLKKK